MSDDVKKDESPNPQIDKAIKDLLKEATSGGEVIPEEMRAKVAVIALAVNWEKVKHNIKDDAEFDANSI